MTWDMDIQWLFMLCSKGLKAELYLPEDTLVEINSSKCSPNKIAGVGRYAMGLTKD
jgi:hypothetical protein